MNSHGSNSLVSKLRTPMMSQLEVLLIHTSQIHLKRIFICFDLPNLSTFGTFAPQSFTSTIVHHHFPKFPSHQATVRRPCGSTSRARAKASEVARSEFAAEMAKMMLLGFSTYFFTKSLLSVDMLWLCGEAPGRHLLYGSKLDKDTHSISLQDASSVQEGGKVSAQF